MQKADGSRIATAPEDRDDAYRSVVSNLAALIAHVQASLTLIESAVALEASGQETSADVIELDDVTPPYVTATAALKACDANLAIALQSLLDSRAPELGTSDLVRDQPALSIVSA